MTPENFSYWLQGYFELTDDGLPLTNTQVEIIKDHLALVFTKVTPDRFNEHGFLSDEEMIEELEKEKEEVHTQNINDEGKIELEFPLDEWKKLITEWEEKNKNPWINPIPQWPQNPTQPFWEVDKKTYNPNWPTFPEIICKAEDKACSDVPDVPTPTGPITQIHDESRNWSIKDIVKNKTFC